MFVQILDRILKRDDMRVKFTVYLADYGGKGSGLTGTGRTRNKYQSSLLVV